MEARKKLYKAGAPVNLTLSERVRKDKGRRLNARQDKFAAGRHIQLDESPIQQKKIGNINDKNEKLKAFRLLKNTQTLTQLQKQRSPFILAVPSGRWLEKKERIPQPRLDLNQTPVRNALMNERVLKKSTVKDLIAKSTAKKENVMIFGKSPLKAVKSKKKILAEFNSVESTNYGETISKSASLNDTFEVLPELDEQQIDEPTKMPSTRIRRSNSMPEIARKVTFVKAAKTSTPPSKAVVRKNAMKPQLVKPMPEKKRNVASKPLPSRPNVASTSRAASNVNKGRAVVAGKSVQPAAKIVRPVTARSVRANPKLSKSKPVVEVEKADEGSEAPEPMEVVEPVEQSEPTSAVGLHKRSDTFILYKSMLDTQISYLKLQLDEIEQNKEKFIENLKEDEQIHISVSIQQGNLLMSEKLRKFAELLDKYEADLSRPEDPKRLSSEDVENYWYLLYEEIDEIKKALDEIRTMKKKASDVMKRGSRRNYNGEGTPRRSQRLAEHVETPKHNASCFGCVTMSASKINTPRSNKRRTAMKKSVLFEPVPETPKGSGDRRTTKRFKATPGRSLVRMNAIDDEDIDSLDSIL